MDQKIHTAINWLSRQQIVELLEGNGMACYDSEETDNLRATLTECIADGDISPNDLVTYE
jgi:hypothetical protein